MTAELLLARPTANPLVAAATFSVTVQLSVPAPAIDALLQLKPVMTARRSQSGLLRSTFRLMSCWSKVSEPVSAPERPWGRIAL